MAISMAHQPADATTGISYMAAPNVSAVAASALNEADANHDGKVKVNVLYGYNPRKYSSKLLRKFYEECVLAQISNTEYEGEIKDYGDTVIIRTTPDIKISSWTKGKELTYDTYETDVVTLTIDKAKSWAFATDPLDQKQTDIKSFVENWTTDASKRMAIAIEKDVFTYLLGGLSDATIVANGNKGINAGTHADYNLGSAAAPVYINKENVLEKVVDCGSVLAERDLPVNAGQDFWMVIPQKMANLLGISDLKAAYLTGDGKSSLLKNGQNNLPKIDIFDIYRSNVTPQIIPVGASYYPVFFGHKSALTFASQLTKNEVLPNPHAFGLLHRGLQVYGFKVIYPKNIGIMLVKFTEEDDPSSAA